MKAASKFIWVEKYRPQTLNDAVLPARFKRFFKEQIDAKQIPNLLLYSATPGSGKCLGYDEILEVSVSAEFYNNNKHLFED